MRVYLFILVTIIALLLYVVFTFACNPPVFVDNDRPQALLIGPMLYSVTWIDHVFKCGDTLANGCTVPSLLNIRVRSDMPAMECRAVLLHEIMHASAALFDNTAEDHSYDDEQIAERAPILLMVLRDNPRLVRYLTEVK